MGTHVIVAAVLILALFSGWVLVQHFARSFARRHPEFGQGREEGGGCGSFCLCSRQERASCPNHESPPSALRSTPEERQVQEGDRHFRQPPTAVTAVSTATEKKP